MDWKERLLSMILPDDGPNSFRRDSKMLVDPLGLFPQYFTGQSAERGASGNYDRYRSNELVPAAGNKEKQDSDQGRSFGDRILAAGRQQLGLPYKLNGDGLTTTDCGKFTLDTFGKAGINLGTRMADEQHDYCKTNGAVFNDISQARPGDLVFFHNTYGNWDPGTITHVGIYAGDGQMLHAGSSTGVNFADLGGKFWRDHFSGFGRPVR